jgi:hypothetical protein
MARKTHVLSVHWKEDRWVDLQKQYFDRHLGIGAYDAYAFLNDLDQDHSSKFAYSSNEPIEDHATKLNLLADIACLRATTDEDILIFTDSDAFPITDLREYLPRELDEYPLVAVQRLENLGDPQPHPCFCFTTVGFWRKIRGDWHAGFQWKNSLGEMVTDVGGNLLVKLEKEKIRWKPLMRSNKTNLHPLWFGVYGDIVYHHGAGSRNPVSRLDAASVEGKAAKVLSPGLVKSFKSFAKSVPILRKAFRYLRGNNPTVWKNANASEEVFQEITKSPEFHRRFVDHGT